MKKSYLFGLLGVVALAGCGPVYNTSSSIPSFTSSSTPISSSSSATSSSSQSSSSSTVTSTSVSESESSSEDSSSSSESSSQPLEYTVTFVAGNGFDNVEVVVTEGSLVEVPSGFDLDYYLIAGWTKDAESSYYDFATPVISAFTLTATWNLNITLAGLGVVDNPYLIADATELNYFLGMPTTITDSTYFKLTASMSYTTDDAIRTTNFNGFLSGDEFTLTLGGNAPLFESVGPLAKIENLIIVPTITSATTAHLGSLARFNSGWIDHVTVYNDGTNGSVISTAGTVNDYANFDLAGAGGLVGVNQATGSITNCINGATVQAKIGGGGIAGINFGTIELCVNNGFVGATGTSVSSTTGAVTATYSFMGGIAGINDGIINKCINTNNVFAQRNAKTASSNLNENLGGIVGFNRATGTISLSINSGRIHGDQYVGGLAGTSEGSITYSYNVGDYGGRFNLGGIAGKTIATSVVDHCYSTTNYNSTSSTNSYKFSDAQAAGTYWALSEFATHSVYSDISYSTTSPFPLRDGAAPISGEGNAAMSTMLSENYTSILGTEFYVYNSIEGIHNQLVWNAPETTYFTVTFVPGEGLDSVEVEVKDGDLVEAPTFSREYYIISEWTKDAEILPYVFTTPVTSEFTLTATWVASLSLSGTGTEVDPYLIPDVAALDYVRALPQILQVGKYFELTANLTYTTVALTNTAVFDGNLNGGGFTITTTGDGPIFATVLTNGFVSDLTIIPTITNGTMPYLASLAQLNMGQIINVNVGDGTTGTVISTGGTVNDFGTLSTEGAGGAGGLVGLNSSSGVITNCINKATVQAKIGGGGLVSVNQGTIQQSSNLGLIGATTTTVSSTTGAAVAAYSYMGGISGINEGTIAQCINNNNVFAQRNAKTAISNGNETIGGITGFNLATGIISLSFNNARIHGDQFVGGIAGQSSGTISYCYNVGNYGARFDLGGIAGKTISTSVVDYCYSTTSYDSTSSTNSYKYSDAQAAGTYWALSEFATNCVYTDVNFSSAILRDGSAPVTGTGNVAISTIPSGDFTGVLGTVNFVYSASSTPTNRLVWFVASLPV